MAIVNQPTPLSNELAWNGDKNPIPDTNDGSKGLFSVEYGFPYVTQQPLAQGGIPPQRNDFNGVLNLLSKFIRYFQNGGVFAYNASMDYSVGMLVRSGDRLYVCKAENGANTSAGVQNISNSNYWNEITLEDTLGDTLTNQLKTVLVTEAEVANNTTDWNSLTESRTYKISGATFSVDKHQPVGAIGTGELVVLKNGDDTIVQVYYANSTEFDKAGAYHRVNVGGAWTDWVYNITNKGGSVTGNFDINGKLTVDSIEVSDQLTIGGAPPLGQDAIDKLQEQIINPSQSIVVDNINGSDETGDGTTSKPYKTINKAVSAIKPNVPDIKIYLNASTDNRIYDVTPIRVKNDKISFLTYDRDDNYVNKNDVAKPIIRLNYGSIRSNWSVDGDLYWWGNMFIYCKEIDITRVRIQLFDPYTEENSARMIFICEKFTGYSMSIEAQSYAVFGMYNTDNSIILGKNNSSIKITGNNYLVVTREKFYSCLKDPKTGDPGTRWILGGSGVFTVVYSIMKDSTTTIDSNILSKNNYGCNNSVHVGFANYSN